MTPTTYVRQAVFGVTDAAKYLHLGQNRVRDLLHDGQLAGWRTSHRGKWLVSKAECEQYIHRQESKARAEALHLVG